MHTSEDRVFYVVATERCNITFLYCRHQVCKGKLMSHRKITALRFRHLWQRCQSPVMVLSSRLTSLHLACARTPIALTRSSLSISGVSAFYPLLCSSVWFGVRHSPSSHLHLVLGQFASLKAAGSPHCVQEEFLVVQYSFYCPKSLQTCPPQRLSAVRAPQHGWRSVAVINATFLPNVLCSNRFLKLHKHNLCTTINYLTENDALS